MSHFGSYEDKLEFLADNLAWLLNVHSVSNDEFMNIEYQPELFKSPIIDDKQIGAIVYKHTPIFRRSF